MSETGSGKTTQLPQYILNQYANKGFELYDFLVFRFLVRLLFFEKSIQKYTKWIKKKLISLLNPRLWMMLKLVKRLVHNLLRGEFWMNSCNLILFLALYMGICSWKYTLKKKGCQYISLYKIIARFRGLFINTDPDYFNSINSHRHHLLHAAEASGRHQCCAACCQGDEHKDWRCCWIYGSFRRLNKSTN